MRLNKFRRMLDQHNLLLVLDDGNIDSLWTKNHELLGYPDDMLAVDTHNMPKSWLDALDSDAWKCLSANVQTITGDDAG